MDVPRFALIPMIISPADSVICIQCGPAVTVYAGNDGIQWLIYQI
jgi:hypothetical protein